MNMKRVLKPLLILPVICITLFACKSRSVAEDNEECVKIEENTDDVDNVDDVNNGNKSEQLEESDWSLYKTDTLTFDDGSILYICEQQERSPFHNRKDLYDKSGRLMAQSALQDARGGDQVILYQYDEDGRLISLHEYEISLSDAVNRIEGGLKYFADSVASAGHYPDTDDYTDYKIEYDGLGKICRIYSDELGRSVDCNEFAPFEKVSVEVVENVDFWSSDLRGGTLVVTLFIGQDGESPVNYTGNRAFMANLRRIWVDEYEDGEFIKGSIFKRGMTGEDTNLLSIVKSKETDNRSIYRLMEKESEVAKLIYKEGKLLFSERYDGEKRVESPKYIYGSVPTASLVKELEMTLSNFVYYESDWDSLPVNFDK